MMLSMDNSEADEPKPNYEHNDQDQKAEVGHVAKVDMKTSLRSSSESSDDCVIIEKPIPVINLCSPDEMFLRQRRIVKCSPSIDSDDDCVIIDEPIPTIDLCSPHVTSIIRDDPASKLCSSNDFNFRNKRVHHWSLDGVPELENCTLYNQAIGNRKSVPEIKTYEELSNYRSFAKQH
ncbi:AAEL009491-PA [Aedes aegypti]|uniref:AAEL009491-PA n=1 Tax=Aedes aegypti TaxID=7159 RepID=Q16VN9_AEDAE|nr:AAEL009491-PA [Aedes aegypti]